MPRLNPESDAFEVFAQFGEGKPVSYVGSVRGADPLLAWHSAKEAYTRREHCTLLWVVPRAAVMASTPQDAVVLDSGIRMSYRVPTYPSGQRRSRGKAAGGENKETLET